MKGVGDVGSHNTNAGVSNTRLYICVVQFSSDHWTTRTQQTSQKQFISVQKERYAHKVAEPQPQSQYSAVLTDIHSTRPRAKSLQGLGNTDAWA